MEKDYHSKEWTIWRVWSHPRLTLRALDNADIMEKELTKRLDDTFCLLESERRKSETYLADRDSLSARLAEKEEELSALRAELDSIGKELADARCELEERKDVETQLKEFDVKLSEIEDLKRGYEKRIWELQSRLRDALGKDREAAADDLLEPGEQVPPIDMRVRPAEVRIIVPQPEDRARPKEEPQSRKGRDNTSRAGRDNSHESDWLLDFTE